MILRHGGPPEHIWDHAEIVSRLQSEADSPWWVVLENPQDQSHSMSFEADDGVLSAETAGQFFESSRQNLTLDAVRSTLIKFFLSDSSWVTDFEWKHS